MTSNDQTFIKAYHEEYIGQSAGLSAIAAKYDTGPAVLKALWEGQGFRLRGRSEAYAARKQAGQPWAWPDDDPAPVAVIEEVTEPAAAAEEATEPQATPEPEPAEPVPPQADPGPGCRAVVSHRGTAAPAFIPTPPERPLWPASGRNGRTAYHNPAMADFAHLVQDLREAGAEVSIALNVELRVG